MKKILSIIGNTLLVIVILIAVVLTFMSFKTDERGVTNIFGYSPLNVQSESMEPTIMTGDFIITKVVDYDSLEKGDIVAFLAKEQDVTIIKTHRIIEKNVVEGQTSFVTKGDNNTGIDEGSVYKESYIGRYEDIRIPYLGTILTFLQGQVGFFVFIVLPLFILFVYQIYKFVNTIMEEKKRDMVDKIREEERKKLEKELSNKD